MNKAVICWTILSMTWALSGCGSSGSGGSAEGDTTDGSTTEGTTTEGGTTEGGTTDGGTTDGGTTDGGTTDGGTTDGGITEGGTTSEPDAGPAPDVVVPAPDTKEPAGDDNDNFDQAIPVEFDAQSPSLASLETTGDTDYFSFEGSKGQVVMIILQAQETPYDKNTIDTVLTLYDANLTQIALNDDPFPRDTNDSTLLTILPEDGTYYATVEECWTWAGKKGLGAVCGDPKDKAVVDYAVYLLNIDSAEASNTLDAETGNTAADATPVGYTKNENTGNYYLTLIYGLFASSEDMDVFSFTLPELPVQAPARIVGYFSIYPAGIEGNGSTTSVGNAYITTAADPATKIAYINGVDGGSLDVPLPTGEDYLLFLQHPGGLFGNNDFYVINHRGGPSNPVVDTEADPSNNDAAGAGYLAPSPKADGSVGYFVDGNLSAAVAPALFDEDWVKFDVPTDDSDVISVACGAENSGSGLRGLKVQLYRANGTDKIVGGAAVETAKEGLFVKQATVPKGDDLMYMHITADSQAADVTSDFYRCGVHFQAAP
jgi:hypothetical protein